MILTDVSPLLVAVVLDVPAGPVLGELGADVAGGAAGAPARLQRPPARVPGRRDALRPAEAARGRLRERRPNRLPHADRAGRRLIS